MGEPVATQIVIDEEAAPPLAAEAVALRATVRPITATVIPKKDGRIWASIKDSDNNELRLLYTPSGKIVASELTCGPQSGNYKERSVEVAANVLNKYRGDSWWDWVGNGDNGYFPGHSPLQIGCHEQAAKRKLQTAQRD